MKSSILYFGATGLIVMLASLFEKEPAKLEPTVSNEIVKQQLVLEKTKNIRLKHEIEYRHINIENSVKTCRTALQTK